MYKYMYVCIYIYIYIYIHTRKVARSSSRAAQALIRPVLRGHSDLSRAWINCAPTPSYIMFLTMGCLNTFIYIYIYIYIYRERERETKIR